MLQVVSTIPHHCVRRLDVSRPGDRRAIDVVIPSLICEDETSDN